MLRPLLILILASAPLAAQQRDFSDVTVRAQHVRGNIHMLTGAGGNVGVVTGSDGVVLIDDQYAPLTPKILAAVRELSDNPVRFVINTHWHGDHTGGNENLGSAGAVIVAHDNVRIRMSSEQFNALWKSTTPPAPSGALPVITFPDSITIHLNGLEVRVIHVDAAHTDGDSFVHFPAADVIHTGDLYFRNTFPYIDTSTGGSLDGLIAASAEIMKVAGNETKIIPGHGALSNLAEFRLYHEMLLTIRTRIAAVMARGLDVEQAVAEAPFADLAGDWGGGFIKADTLVRILYDDHARGSAADHGHEH